MERKTIAVNPDQLSSKTQSLYEELSRKIVGQDRAVKEFCRALGKAFVKMSPPNRPLVSLLFLGPTGVGKTEIAHALADICFTNRNSLIRVDCAEYSNGHEVAKLVGSPPGYLGHEKTNPLLTQQRVDKFKTNSHDFSILIFDEIEKASEEMHDLILGLLDSGKIQLGNNTDVDLRKTIVILTSNLGSRETAKLTSGSGIGFHSAETDREVLDEHLYRVSKEAAHKFFKPELMNRIDRMVSFRSLSQDSLRKILDLMLDDVQERLFAAEHIIAVSVSDAAKEYILREGYEEKFGARELRRKVERFVSDPVANLIGSEQAKRSDHILVGHNGQELTYEVQRLLNPTDWPEFPLVKD